MPSDEEWRVRFDPWHGLSSQILTAPRLSTEDSPLFAVIDCRPMRRIIPIETNEETDDVFASICRDLFHSDAFLKSEEDGITFQPTGFNDDRFALAAADGSITVKLALDISPPQPKALPLVGVWIRLRQYMLPLIRWPQEACGYRGPLNGTIAVGGLVDFYATGPAEPLEGPPTVRNRRSSWEFSFSSATEAGLDDLIEQALGRLARQLNYRGYDRIKAEIRRQVLQRA